MASFFLGLFRRLRQGIARNGLGHVVVVGLASLWRWPRSCWAARRAAASGRDAQEERQFDAEFHVDTAVRARDLAALADVRSANWRHGFGYQASDPESFDRLLGALPIRCEEHVFIDFGSGKGRTLLLAANYPFQKIIGVEYSPALHAIAEQNIAAYRSTAKKCHDIASVCADAASFAIPETPAVLYFYNPFDAVVLAAVVENIKRSLAERPRKIYIVYYNALCADVFAKHGFVELLRQTDNAGTHVIFQNA